MLDPKQATDTIQDAELSCCCCCSHIMLSNLLTDRQSKFITGSDQDLARILVAAPLHQLQQLSSGLYISVGFDLAGSSVAMAETSMLRRCSMLLIAFSTA